jgi:N-acetylmuramoyl-L-alanine amidase
MQIETHTMPRRITRLFITIPAIFSIVACAGVQSMGSANQNSRVSIIVIHHTTADFAESLDILTQPSSRPVSSHYLIPEPGDESYGRSPLKIFKLVDESRRAWHAGTSYWAGKSGLNDQSIGIELVNRTWCHTSEAGANPYTGGNDRLCFFPDFADGQIGLLTGLLEEILARHPDIKPTNIVGHSDIAPDRKVDPGPRFPWQRLAALGYGAWYDDETVIRYWEQFRVAPLPLINIQKALAAYGYGIEATGENDEQTRNVVRAFQLHFQPYEVTREMNRASTAILFALLDKYYPEQLDELLLVEEPLDSATAIENDPVHDSADPPVSEPEMTQ